MPKAAVCNGDPTTTRGVIIAHSSTIFDENRRVALHGDYATCGNCKGSYQIYGSGEGMSELGRKVVVEGDLVMCPCQKNRVLRGSNPGIFLQSSSGTSTASSATPEQAPHTLAAAQRYDQQVQLVDEATGKPLARTRYRLTGDAGTFDGRTDNNGMTDRVASDSPGTMTLEIFGEGV